MIQLLADLSCAELVGFDTAAEEGNDTFTLALKAVHWFCMKELSKLNEYLGIRPNEAQY